MSIWTYDEVYVWWPAFWCLCCPGIRLKALHALLRTDLSKLSPALRFTVKIPMSDCFLLQLSGTWPNLASDVGMNLARANIEAEPRWGFLLILLIKLDCIWFWFYLCWALIKSSISSRKYGNRQLLCSKIWSNLHNKVREEESQCNECLYIVDWTRQAVETSQCWWVCCELEVIEGLNSACGCERLIGINT